MTLAFLEFDPNRVAAIFYRGSDDVDTLLADFARALPADDAGPVVVGKFSELEAAGEALRSRIAAAVAAGRAILTAISEAEEKDWQSFTGDRGTTLFCARHVVDAWWREISTREAIMRAAA